MPIEKSQSQIRVRVKNPDDFMDDSMRTKTIDEAKGISIIMGKMKSNPMGGMVTQAYRFDVDKWDINKVKSWLKEHDIKMMSDDTETMSFADLKDVEIFATGKWNGQDFTEADIDELINSYQEIGNKVKPYVKLGHTEDQKLLQADGLPSAGWISNLKKVGSKLLVDLNDVPKVIAELIKKRAYKRISAEIYKDYEAQPEETGTGAKIYKWVLRAIALLGADTPAVTNLQDIVALYSAESGNRNVQRYEYSSDENNKEDSMTKEELQAKEDALNARAKELESQTEKLTKDKEDLVKLTSDANKKAEELDAKEKKFSKLEPILEKFEKTGDLEKAATELLADKKQVAEDKKKYSELLINNRKQEIATFVDKLIADNKVLPKQKDMIEKLLLSADNSTEVIKFTKEALFGLKEEMSMTDTLKALLNSYPNMGMLKEFSSSKTTSTDVAGERDELIQKYMKENSVKFGDAQIAISKARPDLFPEEPTKE